MSNEAAADGNLFVCCACGKVSTTRYGFEQTAQGEYKSTASKGWDESCMLNASEFPKDHLVWNEGKTRVIEVRKP
jgi:hypothetical protein